MVYVSPEGNKKKGVGSGTVSRQKQHKCHVTVFFLFVSAMPQCKGAFELKASVVILDKKACKVKNQ